MSFDQKIIYSDENIRIEHFFNVDIKNFKVAFVFTPSHNRNLEGNPFGGNIFLKNGFDVIAFKNINDDWYQNIPRAIFNLLEQLIDNNKYTYKVSYGSSMGGFAAIVFSNLLKLDLSVSFSPQYSISEPFDKRWEYYSHKIKFNYLMDSDNIFIGCKFHIFYDNKSLDCVQVNHLKKLIPKENLFLIKIPYSGHPCVDFLDEVNVLKEVIPIISNSSDNLLFNFKFRLLRKYSSSYFRFIAEALISRGKYKSALYFINQAIALQNNFIIGEHISSKVADFHHLKSIILSSLYFYDEALHFSAIAALCDPKNFKHPFHSSKLLLAIGNSAEAINCLIKAISLDNSNHLLYYKLSIVYFDIGCLDDSLININKALELDASSILYLNHKNLLLLKI
jgi:tetratricopeptide (TPR) repeat protein